MKDQLTAVENEGEQAQAEAEDDIVGGMLSKKSLFGFGRKCVSTGIDRTREQHLLQNADSNVGLQRLVEEQAEQIDSQRVIIADQAATILEMQCQQAATDKAVSEMKGELNEIYRVLDLRQNGSGMYV